MIPSQVAQSVQLCALSLAAWAEDRAQAAACAARAAAAACGAGAAATSSSDDAESLTLRKPSVSGASSPNGRGCVRWGLGAAGAFDSDTPVSGVEGWSATLASVSSR